MNEPNQKFLTVAEAARRSGVHEDTLARWLRSGRITPDAVLLSGVRTLWLIEASLSRLSDIRHLAERNEPVL